MKREEWLKKRAAFRESVDFALGADGVTPTVEEVEEPVADVVPDEAPVETTPEGVPVVDSEELPSTEVE